MVEKIVLPPQEGKPSDVEEIKAESNYLRGTLAESMEDELSAGISDWDNRLMKFHGSYLQDDRDVRQERERQKLEPAYQFMVRVRMPGGVATPTQWLKLDELSDRYGNQSFKITTRQTVQFHGILKWNMKKHMQELNSVLFDTYAACGDVNRNVMCNANPYQSKLHQEIFELSSKISEHLLPRSNAYYEIWLDKEKIVDTQEEQEPIYGALYLPRKFKIAIAIPPANDVDVFSQDIGLIAVVENDELVGFNVAIGGGMGMTHGDTATYPQLSRLIGYIPKDKVVDACEKIMTVQRDYGNRSVRKNARFKYTVDRLGLENVKKEIEKRLGYEFEEERPYTFEHTGDRFGWIKGEDGKYHFTLFIQNGRVKDFEHYPLKTALREIAQIHKGEFRFTGNQNVVIANVGPRAKKAIDEIIEKYHLTDSEHYSALRRNSIACVALPTCGLAMAEAERYLPSLIEKIETILDENGLREQDITIRMSGCPNGCSRAAMGEIGFIGKGPGKYNLYLGASHTGTRLNKMYKENIGEEEILATLRPIIEHYAKERLTGEHFGDFVIRAGYVEAVTDGRHFHNQA
ncbi:assimilatory sulfite reductase (NADPH) hemoprotein subunit [Ureibacillus sp. 179-F W5.1 NHS]|uniref:Sulfite reductase [NADPH] hemoprotein beta-component n=1 Tax=Lysinibacillus halotolerans TaxID=1368476 RepID=A0A3M8H5K5_9BACI|nr:assimilatory sulfite reductase (NADPH) hemoprotein subunit [Lysinibacillus halotolerans]RNC97697.1 assimilatory sulfite reductase (NADPH) hemoprotein subunit [Lysinibacillus halotolerans]